MNYILTLGEVKTLAGLLGAESFFSMEEEQVELSREDVIQNVFLLTQRGFLTQRDNGFLCEPEIKEMLQQLIRAQHAVVLLIPERAQLCCYVTDTKCIVLEKTLERTTEYKLNAQPLEEVFLQWCPPEDVISDQKLEMDTSELYFDVMPTAEYLSVQVDIYSLLTQSQKARGLVKRTPMGKAQAFYDGTGSSVAVYRQQEFCRQIIEQVGGNKI